MVMIKSLKSLMFLLIGMIFFWNVAEAIEKKDLPTIYWLFFDFPSAVDRENPSRPGSLVEMHRVLIERMPEYKHQVVDIPAPAAIQQIKMKKGSCSLMFLKNAEREEYMMFSSPLFSGYAAGAYVRKNDVKIKKYLHESKLLNLDELLKDKSIRLGVQHGRFYGKKIAESLKKRKGVGVLTKKSLNGDKEFRSMLLLGRIDSYFGYPVELKNKSSLEFFYIKDNYEILEPRVSCEKSQFGEEVLTKIQEARQKYRLDVEFSKIYKSYYSDQDE